MKEKRWITRKDYDLEVVEKLADSLGVDKIIATLLVERGVTTFEEAKHFFRPSLDQLHDPFLMKDMDRAIARINEALRKKERMLIYGDYDVDGVTASTVMETVLTLAGIKNPDIMLPDRFVDGYGMSPKLIKKAQTIGATLIITVDCGSRNHEARSGR